MGNIFQDVLCQSLQNKYVYAIRKKLGRPQIISTSRHITQGAVDLISVSWDDKKYVLSGISNVVAKEPYQITFFVPDDYKIISQDKIVADDKCANIQILVIYPWESGEISWSVEFVKLRK